VAVLMASASMPPVEGKSEETFDEELLLRPVADGDVVAHFNFRTLAPEEATASVGGGRHFHLFPRALGELAAAHGVAELKVDLTRGVWRQERWGLSPHSAPPGARVSAWFDPSSISASGHDVDKAWTGLTNALAGQLCASLNFLYSTQTVSPRLSFQVRSIFSKDSNSSKLSLKHC